jgi:hypothetical protein
MMKQFFLSISITAIVLSISAFTSTVRFSEGNIYVQDADDMYNYISPIDYSMGTCLTSDDSPCSVQVTTRGAENNVESSAPFTDAEVSTYTSGNDPWLLTDGCNCLFER